MTVDLLLVAAAIVALLAVGGIVAFLAWVRFRLTADPDWSPVDVRPERRS